MKQTGTPAESAAPGGAPRADALRYRHPVNQPLERRHPVLHRWAATQAHGRADDGGDGIG